jgi:hypothetical protein
MSTLKRAIRFVLVGVLGQRRSESVLRRYGDVRSAVSYRIDPAGRRSAAELDSLKDHYRGRRCFIIGNGPSLSRMDLSPLRNELTFGLNRIYLLYERLGFPTTFLVAVNKLVVAQCAEEIASAPARKFISWHARHHLLSAPGITYLRSVSRPHFSLNPAAGLWEGATVTYVALQLAYHMGFEEVILIGVDHSFSTAGQPHAVVTSSGGDPNHFDPNYFGKGFRWQLPDLETSELAYQMARTQYDSAGRRVLDATLDGKLTVFPKVDFEEVLTRDHWPAES